MSEKDDERTGFEAWVVDNHVTMLNGPYANRPASLTQRTDGGYVSIATQQLWECWQAGYEKGSEAMY